MIVELVTFTSPSGWDRGRVLDDAKTTIPKWTANRELLRKHFLLGLARRKAPAPASISGPRSMPPRRRTTRNGARA